VTAARWRPRSLRCLDEALHTAGVLPSLFRPGENVQEVHAARVNLENVLPIFEALGQAGLDVHVSLIPRLAIPSFPRHGKGHMRRLGATMAVRPRIGHYGMALDMETSSRVEAALAMQHRLR
jgi:hypothetical protein